MSVRTLILAVTGFVVSVAACSSYDGSSVVEIKTQAPVASVVVTLPSTLTAGQKTRGVAITKDANGAVLSGRPISWFTSSGSVASVTDSGMISAVAPGTAVLSAVSEGVSGQATMAVLPPPPAPVATVAVAVTPSAVVVGQTATATATLADSSGNLLSGRVVTWSSSNTTVATVDAGGTVSAKAAGSAMIQATSEGKTGASSLSVSAPAPIPVASVSVSPPTASLQVAGSTQLSAVTRDANGNVLTGRVIAWSSANTGIARVSASGLVTAVAAGSVSVTASSEGQIGSSVITVSAPAPVPVASVTVAPTSSSLLVGAAVQLSPTTRDANNNVLTGRVVTWSSSNSSIASVNSSGLVTALAAGSATITATSETKTGTAAITVTAPAPAPVATVSVSPSSPSLLVGATVQLSATTRDANNNVLTGRVIIWSSANTSIASVNSTGVVTAIGVGTIQITATSEGKSGSASITVTAPPPPPPPGSSHEPSGMTVLTDRPFNSLTEDAGWITQGLSIAQDATAPKSPTSVIRATYPTGFVGGSAPGVAEFDHPGHSVIYISYWAKLSSNFWGHLTGVNKQLYEWGNGIGLFYFEAAGVGSDPLEPRVVLQGTPADAVLTPNLVSNATIPRGVWYNVEIVLNGNSSGAADGTVDWWVNGVHVGSYSGRQFTSGATTWGIFQFEPVWGGITDAVPATMTQDWDHLYISGKN